MQESNSKNNSVGQQHIVLASASPRRKDLLQQIGIDDFTVVPADIDESVKLGESVRPYVLRMACEKARVCAKARVYAKSSTKQDEIIIAGDTVVALGKRILPKAEDRQTAKDCLQKLSGRRHSVYGGLCVKVGDIEHTTIIKTVVKFKNLSPQDITYYLDSNEWQGKAGGYAIQGLAGRYISFISGSYSNVVGMDIHTISKWLEKYGY